MKPENITKDQWQEIRSKLEAKQKQLSPGDTDIMDIANVIQLIDADAFGNNYGHVKYFQQHPADKATHLEDIVNQVTHYLPELVLEEQKTKN